MKRIILTIILLFALPLQAANVTFSDKTLGSIFTHDDANEIKNVVNGKQDQLISGENIKTINGVPVLGSGDIVITSETGSTPEGTAFDPSQDIVFLGNIDLSQAASVLFGPIYLNEPAADGTSYASFSVPALASNRTITIGDYNMQIPLETGVDSDGKINETGLADTALTTTKVVTGTIATAIDSDAHTFTDAEIHGGTVLATGAGIYGPLTAAAGISGCVQKGQGVTGIVQLLPASGDYIVKDGVRGTVATSIKSSTGLGEWICFKCVDATDIYVEVKGTWAE